MDNKNSQTKIWKAPKGKISTFFSKNKYFKISGIFIFLLALAVGCLFFINKYVDTDYDPEKGKVVFVIDKTKVYQSDVESVVGYLSESSGKNQTQVLDEIIELYKYKIIAETNGIMPDKEYLEMNKKTLIQNTLKDSSKIKGFDEWYELQGVKDYVENDYFSEESTKDKSFRGYSYVFWFGNRLLKSDEYTPPGGYDNQELKDEDRQYAKRLAEEVRLKLKEHKISNDEALAIANKDPKIGLFYTTNIPQSKQYGFSIASFWRTDVVYSSIADFIASNSKTGLSEIQIGKADSANPGDEAEWVDAFYFFIDNKGSNLSRDEFIKNISNIKVVKKYEQQ